MKRKTALLFLASLLSIASCSFLTPATESDSSSATSKVEGDQGYLKITRMTSGYYTTDYVFVSEEGYQFFATGKMADGRDASYTYSATWESSDKSIFVVDNMGRVKALANGSAMLKATYENYHDEIEVKVATCAEKHEIGETEGYYRTHRTYDLPYHVEPANALVEYSFSEEGAVEINGTSFIPKKSGEIAVTARVYVNQYGLPREDKFTLNVIENELPYFIYDEKETKEVELDVAINKYQTLNWRELGITAFAGDDDSDITSNITVKSGQYDLTTVGEYPLTLAVSNKGVEATLSLKLNITERETVMTRVSNLTIGIEDLTWTMASDLKSITFRATAVLPDGYEDYWGELGFDVQVYLKRRVSGQEMILSKYSSRFFEKSPAKKYSVTTTCVTDNNLEMRAGDENVRVARAFCDWSGVGYNYITYEP